ncbi:MAG: hypothetical protein Q4Q06_01125 [Bacteroidota bacterium]|nr:hypothetical protein [Bacteroidota bacterium]
MTAENFIAPNQSKVSSTEQAYQKIYKMRNKALMNMFVRQSNLHKRQHVATIGNISFFDDAFSLSPNATWFAFYQSTTSIIWIFENLNKEEIDFSQQMDVIKDKVAQIVVIDSFANDKTIERLKKNINVVLAKNMQEAVELAFHLASKDMSVVYSPASGTPDIAEQRAKEYIKNVFSL